MNETEDAKAEKISELSHLRNRIDAITDEIYHVAKCSKNIGDRVYGPQPQVEAATTPSQPELGILDQLSQTVERLNSATQEALREVQRLSNLA